VNALMAWAAATFLNALWQTALIFCAAWLAARLLRPAGPRAVHRVWIAALLLEALLPFCRLQPGVWLERLRAIFTHTGDGAVTVRISAATSNDAAQPWLPGWAQRMLAITFLMLVVIALLRVGRSLWRTNALLRRAEPVEPAGELALVLETYADELGIDPARVSVARLDDLHGPATLGLFRHTLLLPADLLAQSGAVLSQEEREELSATLAHELEHIRRRDFAWNLLFSLIALPVDWHPLMRLTRGQIDETRELAVDDRAAALLAGNKTYARSLVRIATRLAAHPALRPIEAMGIYDSNIFERRIVNLMRKAEEVSWMRRAASVAGCAVLALAASYTAMALQTNVNPPGEAAKNEAPVVSNGVVSLSAAQAAGNLVSKVTPVYPAMAKAAGMEGTVSLDAVIDKEGHMKMLHVISGPAMLQQSSMDAVKQWVYKPYLLNGEPVEVKTEIHVIYTLGSKHPEKSDAQPEEKAVVAIPPSVIKSVDAKYPPEAKVAHQEGVVIVKTKIDASGRPTVLGVEGPEVFWKSAKAAVEQYSFQPAMKDGQPAEAKVNIEVNFKLY
jgi:TonB family protein